RFGPSRPCRARRAPGTTGAGEGAAPLGSPARPGADGLGRAAGRLAQRGGLGADRGGQERAAGGGVGLRVTPRGPSVGGARAGAPARLAAVRSAAASARTVATRNGRMAGLLSSAYTPGNSGVAQPRP